MADKDEKYEGQPKGKFYVDTECILCSACVTNAPDNFKESDDGDHDVVYKQPENEDEESQCYDAMSACPVDAIGDDGDDGEEE